MKRTLGRFTVLGREFNCDYMRNNLHVNKFAHCSERYLSIRVSASTPCRRQNRVGVYIQIPIRRQPFQDHLADDVVRVRRFGRGPIGAGTRSLR